MNLYAIAIYVHHKWNHTFRISIGQCWAIDSDQALGIAYRMAHEKYPEAQDWSDWLAIVKQIGTPIEEPPSNRIWVKREDQGIS